MPAHPPLIRNPGPHPSLPWRRRLLQGAAAWPLTGWLGQALSQTPAPAAASPAPAPAGRIGVADFVSGNVTLRRGGAALTAAQGIGLQAGDLIETAGSAELHARFDDGGYLAVRPNSSVRIDRYVAQGEASDVAAFELLRGALRSVTGWIGKIGSTQQYQIRAGTATVGVRGTDHELVYIPDDQATPDAPAGIHNRVNEGATVLSNERGQVQLAQGTAGFAPRSGELPRLQQRMPALFERLRSGNDSRVLAARQNIRSFMENRLRERGKLQPGQNFQNFVARHPRIAASANPATAPANATAGNQRAEREARQAARRQQREQREQANKPATPASGSRQTANTAGSETREQRREALRAQREQQRERRAAERHNTPQR